MAPQNHRLRAVCCSLLLFLALTSLCGRAQSTTGVRLRDGSTQWDGRVEILINKTWGTVCDGGWDLNDANVICRQLGFSQAVEATAMSAYPEAQPNERVWVEGLECEGGEGDIGECGRVGEWGDVSSTCLDHSRDAGAICADNSAALSVRLAGGDSEREGRLEVFFGDQWGGVCDDGWGVEETTVVCRELGLVPDTAENQPTSGEFGEGGSVTWLDDVICGGGEARLADCSHTGWGEHNCAPSENIGVRCTCSLRLSTLDSLDRPWAGLVELFTNDEWGRVCAEDWGLKEAEVVCRNLGFRAVLETRNQVFDPPSDLYWLAGVNCTGSEAGLCDCHTPNGIINSQCSSTSDAGVVCQSEPYDLRLVGGVRPWEGRVEVSVNGEWGTVCAASSELTQSDFDVICRQLGHKEALILYLTSAFGTGTGVHWFQSFNCAGDEESVFDCPRDLGIGEVGFCTHSFDASVICQANGISEDYVAPLRLVGGATPYEGQLQVLYNGHWGKVCTEGWDETAATISCSQLGYGAVLDYTVNLPFDPQPDMPGPVPFWLDDLACRGNETALSSCPHSMWGKHDCSQTQTVGLACAEPNVDPHDLRLVDGQTESSGRLEVLYGGVWGTVCGVGWDLDDAEVTCRQLGFHGALTLLGNDTIPEGVGVVWLEGVGCHGNESRLAECELLGWGLSQCDHSQDIGVTCNDLVSSPSLPIATPLSTLTTPTTSPMMLLPLPSSSATTTDASKTTPFDEKLTTPTEKYLTTPNNEHSSSLATPTSVPRSKPFTSDLAPHDIPVAKTTYSVPTKATPTNDLSNSEENNAIQSPVVVIGGSILGVIFAVSVTTIAIIVIFLLIRLRRKGRVKICDTVGRGKYRAPTSRAAEGSPSISFSSVPQHTQGVEDEPDRSTDIGRDGADRGGNLMRNFQSPDPVPNIYCENPFTTTDDDSEPATPDHMTSHVTQATPTTQPIPNSGMEMGNLLKRTDTPSTSNIATFV